MKKQAMQIEVMPPRDKSKSDAAMERLASMVAQRPISGTSQAP
jgi:hypothetical protein